MPGWARDRARMQILALVSVVAVLLAAGIWLATGGTGRRITAYFTNASALFDDNAVTVLGVNVGTIDKITPQGTQVRVDMTITDPDVQLPADVKAVVVSPSLVTGRYVELAPVWTGGPRLADGAVIPLERTAVPLGVDDLSRTATQLADALGPNGANKTGALSDVLGVAAANLDGNGQALNDTIHNLGQLSTTLSGSSDDLFGTITQLQKVTETLKNDDGTVREFTDRLDSVTRTLADQREDLGGALQELSLALGEVQAFIADNRAALKSDVDKLTDVTGTLADEQRALAEILDVAPAAVGNLSNTYNGASGTLDTRANINELSFPPVLFLCTMLQRSGTVPAPLGDTCRSLEPVISGAVPLPSAAAVITSLQQGQVPAFPAMAVPVDPPIGLTAPALTPPTTGAPAAPSPSAATSSATAPSPSTTPTTSAPPGLLPGLLGGGR
ncbi:MCE family protein [Pseudonocardia sp. D17]|uniref:MCE family protein n=1 Tax=Pseudonocardia sp. D17 TaxID=882661 RepID=UPI002B393637|nr:ABC transporter substrate-binding protein [Pseudonocardia sp. D17]